MKHFDIAQCRHFIASISLLIFPKSDNNKKKTSFLFILILSFSLAACSQKISDDAIMPTIDKGILISNIASAQSLHDNAVEGSELDEYKEGSKAIFQAVINTVQLVVDNETATQADVDEALSILYRATIIFNSKINGRLSITQFGITWIFDTQYPHGQFANGDYWVVGPVNIIYIDPLSVDQNGRIINGAMINPDIVDSQGYDSQIGGDDYEANYDPNLNAARPYGNNISESNPLVISPSPVASLICGISEPEAGTGICHQVPTMAVLTILDSIPDQGSFRPPYCGSNKTVKFDTDDLNYDLLANLPHVDETPSLAEIENNFERAWIDNWQGWMGELYHPADNMPFYGREMSAQVGTAALMLHLNFTDEEKETLLIRFVQLGIDNYQVKQVPGGNDAWRADGGHMSGRAWPIIFAGLMLDNNDMKNICEKSGDYAYLNGSGEGNLPLDYQHFGELDQTFYVKQSDIDRDHEPDPRSVETEYSASDLNLPEWGIEHTSNPIFDNKTWETVYRFTACISWSGFILATYIMDQVDDSTNIKGLWNHNALFDYHDRYMSIADGYLDSDGNPIRTYTNFEENMWDNYRNRPGHPPVWGMVSTKTIDHHTRNLNAIPDEYITAAKDNLVIAYGHTSHGSQIISGMNALATFPEFGDKYAWGDDGTPGELQLHDFHGDFGGNLVSTTANDLGNPNENNWVTATREYLNNPSNPGTNVVIWSWCDVDNHAITGVDGYLEKMESLISDYPEITFVFMTGHALRSAPVDYDGYTSDEAETIKEYCINNDRWLFDYWDMEAYDLNDNYYGDNLIRDNLDYYIDGEILPHNWAVDWINNIANSGSQLYQLVTGDGISEYSGCLNCAHSELPDGPDEAKLNCVLKGQAAWWLFARIAGWDGQ